MTHAAASAAAASFRRWARGVILGSSRRRAAPGVLSYLQSQSQSASQTSKARVRRLLRPTRGHQKGAYIRPSRVLMTEGLKSPDRIIST